MNLCRDCVHMEHFDGNEWVREKWLCRHPRHKHTQTTPAHWDPIDGLVREATTYSFDPVNCREKNADCGCQDFGRGKRA